ncbi:MAG: hypothetical protein IT338_03910 [Thermomicrobiales bacterium]|nr:hypothetical protein [Thermomicrobiales bacterium]
MDRLLVAIATVLMLAGVNASVFDSLPSLGLRLLVACTAMVAAIGGLLAPHGGRVAFTLLWAAFGMAAALGTIGIFSIGLIFLTAALLVLLAIFLMPNRSEIALRYDWRFILAFAIGYIAIFAAILV